MRLQPEARTGAIRLCPTSEDLTELLPGWEASVDVRTQGPTFLVGFERRTDLWSAELMLSTMNKETNWKVRNHTTGEEVSDFGPTFRKELRRMLAAVEAIEAAASAAA